YPQSFHLIVGSALAVTLIASGVVFGPIAQGGRLDLFSSGVLACYLLGGLLLVIASRHDSPALVTLFVLCATTVAAAWRSEAVTPALGAAAIAGSLVVAHWSVSEYFVTISSPGGPYSAVPPVVRLDGLRAHALL